MSNLISIITINFNNKDGLVKTIDSVLSQTFTEIEYIIIDGASTDGSVEVLNTYKNRVAYCVSEKDNGIYEAMNKGIAIAKGEYLLFLNSGDYLSSSNILKEIIPQLTGEDIIYGNLYQDVCGRLVQTIYPPVITAKYFFSNSIPHPASFIRKELFTKYGYYNTKLKLVSDWEFFFLAVCKFNCSVKHIPFFVSVYNLVGLSRKSGTLPQEERKLVIDMHFHALKKKYEKTLKVEKILLIPLRVLKKGYRFVLRIFGVNRVYVKDI